MIRLRFKLHSKSIQRFASLHSNATQVIDKENKQLSNSETRPFEAIPCLPTVPLLGSMWSMLPYVGKYDRTRFHETLYEKYKEYGKLVREDFRNLNILWVFDANNAETVFRNEGKLPRRDGFDAMKLYRKLRPKYYSHGGLLLVQGEEWYNFRSKTQPYLLKPKLVQMYVPVMNSIANEMVARIDKLRLQNDNKIDDFVIELYRWALESIGVVALDRRLGCLQFSSRSGTTTPEILLRCISNILAHNGTLDLQVIALWRLFKKPIGSVWSKFIKFNDKFTGIVMQYINEAKEKLKEGNEGTHTEKSILELLLSRPDFSPSEAVTMTLDMFLAGIDTTSHSLIYTLYFLAINKQLQEVARNEVRNVVGDRNEITAEMLDDMHYLRACIKESQRLLPVVPMNVRILHKEIVLSGYSIPPKTIIGIGHYVMGRMEEYYADPLVYKPERWIKTAVSGSNSKRVYSEEIHPFATLPFGFGPRMCIGRRIATQEQLLLLSKLLQNYEIGYNGNELRLKTSTVTKPDEEMTFTFNKIN